MRVVAQRELPEFRSHGFDKKFEYLSAGDFEPDLETRRLLDFLRLWLKKPIEQCVVLDLGCGRGALVGALRRHGVRAFGVEVDARFVESGRIVNELFPDELDCISLVGDDGRCQFSDGYFDVIISDQVLEHVSDLGSVVSEISRLLKPGGETVHRFPAKFRVIEPHYCVPLVHWLPKSRVRWHVVRAMLLMRFGQRYFPEFDVSSRADIIYKYSVEETFYRPNHDIESVFRLHGFTPSLREGMRVFVGIRFGNVPLAPFVAFLFGQLRGVMFTATKPVRP